LSKPDGKLTNDDFVENHAGGESTLPTAFESSKHAPSSDGHSPIWPVPNISTLLFLRFWHNGQTEKSQGECSKLILSFHHPYFFAKEILERGVQKVRDLLKSANSDKENPLYTGEGWKISSLKIKVPFLKSRPRTFKVDGLHHCSIVNVVTAALTKRRPPASAFHYTPFRSFWKSPTPLQPEHTERVFDEIYASDTCIREYEKIQNLPPAHNPDGMPCTLERSMACLMMWSDATQLGNVGQNKLWPIYMFLGNQSKVQRGKGTGRECHHLAYIPSVSNLGYPHSTKL
jgi:hypothetical protein